TSSLTPTTQGGIVNPGASLTSPGTLNVPTMTWQPLGQYIFTHNANSNVTGGGINGLPNGPRKVDLSTPAPATQFDINLNPITFAASTPGPTNYTIATFAGGITGQGASSTTPFPDQTILAGTGSTLQLFTFSGQTFPGSPAPIATVVGAAGGSQ